MATSTVLEPICVNDENGATVIVNALEQAEQIPYRNRSNRGVKRTTDPDAVRKATAKAMSGVGHG